MKKEHQILVILADRPDMEKSVILGAGTGGNNDG
jgi:hypothetical protein